MIYDKIALNNGVIYQHAYDVLSERTMQTLKDLQKGNVSKKLQLDLSLTIPSVICCAFASELYIKSMLPQRHKGHKLHELFSLLDDDVQSRVSQGTIDHMKAHRGSYSEQEFQEDLLKNSKLFEEWRYFHEGGNRSFNLQFIASFMKALLDVARKENDSNEN